MDAGTGSVRRGFGLHSCTGVCGQALIALVLAAFVVTGLLGALLPEVEFDALWYHLPLPQAYLLAGRLVDLPNTFSSHYPKTVEMLFALGLAWNGPITAKLVHFVFGLLAVGATYRLARRWLNRQYSLLAALAFLAVPTVHWELTTAHVDLAVICFVTLSLSDLVTCWDEPDDVGIHRAGLMMGLALASKHSALLFLPGAMLLVVARSLRMAASLSSGEGYRSIAADAVAWLKAGLRVQRWMKPPLIFLGIVLVVPLPWYVLSWLATGNPVFPELSSVFGVRVDQWTEINEDGVRSFLLHFGVGRDVLTLLTLPWHVTVSGPQFAGSLGPVFLKALPLAGLVILTPGARGRGLRILAGWALLGTALWATPFSSFQLRYLLPVLPAVAVLSAAGLAWLTAVLRSHGWRHLAGAVLPVATLVLAFNLPPFIPWHGPGWAASTAHELDLAGVVDAGAASNYIARHVPAYPAISFVNDHVAPPVRILTFVDGFDYYSRYPLLHAYAPTAQPATFASGAERESVVIETLRREGITHVILPSDLSDLRSFGLAITSEAFIRRYLSPVYEDERVVVYELRL